MEIPDAFHDTDNSSLRDPNPPDLSSPSTPSFLRLSPELRNQIYQHLYTSSVFKIASDTPGLPLTCKQIYAECTDLLYASTAFYVEDWETLLRWLKQLPPSRRSLITEIWCGADIALPDDPKANVTCHGVLRRMARRLENLGLGLGGRDVPRSGVQIDDMFNVWSSDPTLAWLVINRAYCDWAVSSVSQWLSDQRKANGCDYRANGDCTSFNSYLLWMRYGCG